MRRAALMPAAIGVCLLFVGGAGAQARPRAPVRPRPSPRSRVITRKSGAWATPFRHASRAVRTADATYDASLKAANIPTETDQCDWGNPYTGEAVVEDPIVKFPGIHVGGGGPQKCGVEKLENDAYEMYAQTHGLTPGDPRIELNGQYEIAGNLFALLLGTVSTHQDNPAGLDAYDQGAYDWLQSKVLNPLRAAAQNAKDEYDKWARAPCAYSPPDTRLFNFTPAVDPACGTTVAALLRGPTPPSFEEFLQYGTYDANKTVPAGLQLAQYNQLARQRLNEGLGVISSFLFGAVVHVINLATAGKLLRVWKRKLFPNSGKAKYLNDARTKRARNAQRRVQFKQEEVDQELKDLQREERLAQQGLKTDEVISETTDKVIEDSTKAGENVSRVGAELGAEALDGPAIIVGLAIDVLVSEITKLQTELAIPGQLQDNLDRVNKETLDDLLLGSQSDGGYQTAKAYFEGQLDLTAPKIGTPADPKAGKPSTVVGSAPFDGSEWEVTDSDAGGTPLKTTFQPTVGLVTWPLGVDRGVHGLNTPQFAYFHGQVWHPANSDATKDDDTAAGLQGWLPSGELRYFDWEGNPRIAIVDGDHFLDMPSPGSTDLGGQDQSDLCAGGDAECDSTNVLFALKSAAGVHSSPKTFAYDADGNRGVEQQAQASTGSVDPPYERIRLTIKPDPGAEAVQNINNQWGKGASTYDHPTSNDGGLFAGSTVTLVDPEANLLGYPTTYTWTVESRCAYPSSCTPDPDPAFHGNPSVTLKGQSVPFTWPAPGKYHVRLTTSDQYGATQVSDQDVTVLGHNPTFTLGSSTGFAGAAVFGPVRNGSPQTITGCITDPEGPYVNPKVTLDWGDGTVETQSGRDSTSSTLSFTHGATAGCPGFWQFAATHTYNLDNPNNVTQIQKPLHIGVDDGQGYSSARDLAINVDLTSAPKFTSANSTSFPAGETNTFVVRTAGTPTPSLSCAAPCTLPPGIQLEPQGNGTALLTGATGRPNQGTYPITIQASNSQGTASQSFTLTVTAPPLITSSDTATVRVGQSSPVNLSASGTPSPGMFVGGTLPAGMVAIDSSSGGTASITGTPTAIGSYPLTVTASSSSGTATQPFTLVVGSVPTFTSPSSAGFVQNASPSTFTISTSGFPTAAISCDSPCTLPSGLSFHDNGDGTARIYGSASAAGSNQVTLTATNGAGSAQQTLTVTSSPTSGPNITFPSGATYDSSGGLWNAQMQIGSPATVQMSASPSAGVTMTESGALPQGMSFTDNGNGTATISGTPASGSGGVYGLLIKAHPGQGADGIAFLTLQVEGAPTMTSSSQALFVAGQSGTFTITTSGLPRAGISLADALPAGLHFTDNGDGTATISGTPSADAVGGHTVGVRMGNLVTFPDSVTASLDIEVGQPPAITSAATAGFGEGRAGSFNVKTGGYPDPTLQVVSGTLPPGIDFKDNGDGTATFSGTPTDTTDTSYALTVAASSSAGTTSQVLTLAIGPAPSIAAQDTASFTAGSSGSAPVNSPTTPTPSFSASGLPGGLSLTDHGDGTAAIQGTPDAGTGGRYTVTVTAANAYGSTTKDIALSVAETPRFLGTQSGLTCAGGVDPSLTETSFLGAGSWTLCASGYPTPTLGYAGVLPAGVTFEDNGDGSGTFSGKAAAGKGGAFPLTLLAVNTAGQSQTPLRLTIDQPVSQAPLRPITWVAEQPNDYTLTAPGYPLPTLRLTPGIGCGTAPDWLKFKDNDDGTATLKGSPPASAMGQEFDFSVREEQGVGNGAYPCVTINVAPVAVKNAAPPPSTVGSGYDYVFTSTDPSATYAAVPADSTATSTLRNVLVTRAAARRSTRRVLPPGLHLSKRGVLSGKPTTIGKWIFRIVVTTRRGRAVSRPITIRGRSAAHQLEIRAFRLYGPGGAGDWFVAARNTTRVAMPLFGWRVAVLVPGQRRTVYVALPPGRLGPGATIAVAGPSFTLRRRTRVVVGPPRTRIPSGFELIAPDGRVSDRAGQIGAPRSSIERTGVPALDGRQLSSQGAYVRRLSGTRLIDTSDNFRDFAYRRLNPPLRQRIRFRSHKPHRARVGGAYRIRAVGGRSGEPVKLALGPGSGRGVCAMRGRLVRFTDPGTCVIVASQRGGLLFSSAAPVRQVIRVRARRH